ncbi:MAG: glutaminase A [Geminicoccaceae bacterium]
MSRNGTSRAKRTRTGHRTAKTPPRQLRVVSKAAGVAAAAHALDVREERLFRSLDINNDQRILRSDLDFMLGRSGLRSDDRRLKASMEALNAFRREGEDARREEAETPIPSGRFRRAIRHNILLIERALQGKMVIPDFADFAREIDRIYGATRENRSGKAADYIPQLDLKEPEVDQYGVALCTVDGQRHSVGDSHVFFPVESTCKPANYCMALEEHGEQAVHAYIGHEPSGASFNELALDKLNRPHNPMINAGAIMSCALIKLGDKQRQAERTRSNELDARGWAGARFDYVMDRWQALCGGEKPRFSTPVYLSERETADRNFALGYYMREKQAFPQEADLDDVLDFYFQCCSIEVTADMMSVVASTLANGGVCPVTGERIFATETVQNCLSLMSSCGMYDFSGEFAFTIGLPAKSGVCGGIMIVIPNVMGLCTWSPRLDAHGNSVRGIDFCRELVKTFSFHNYDILTGTSGKKDPRVSRIGQKAMTVNELIWAASKGDLGAIQTQLVRGAELACADYDLRTPLHLAAAENQADVVKFFVEQGEQGGTDIDLNPRDRWGGTPLDDAYAHDNSDIIALLERAGGRRAKSSAPADGALPPVSTGPQAESLKTAELIWAASVGDLVAIYRLVAQGVPLDIADYDQRTPLHLAAAEGHLDVVRYFIAQKANLNPQDRWGNTPLEEATRHGQGDVADLLKQHGGQTADDLPRDSTELAS